MSSVCIHRTPAARAIQQALSIQPTLQALTDAISSLAGQPNHYQYQNDASRRLDEFEGALRAFEKAVTPVQKKSLDDIAAGEYFDSGAADAIRAEMSKNSMTPAVVQRMVEDFFSGGFLQ